MKKIILMVVSIVMFAACTKENEQINNAGPGVRATVINSGSPAIDGYGWILRLTADTFEVPSNLPPEFQKDSLAVNVAYKKSDKIFPCRCTAKRNYVDIISISRVDAAGPK